MFVSLFLNFALNALCPNLFLRFVFLYFLLPPFLGSVTWCWNFCFFPTAQFFDFWDSRLFDDCAVRYSIGKFPGRREFAIYFWHILAMFMAATSLQALSAILIRVFFAMRRPFSVSDLQPNCDGCLRSHLRFLGSLFKISLCHPDSRVLAKTLAYQGLNLPPISMKVMVERNNRLRAPANKGVRQFCNRMHCCWRIEHLVFIHMRNHGAIENIVSDAWNMSYLFLDAQHLYNRKHCCWRIDQPSAI